MVASDVPLSSNSDDYRRMASWHYPLMAIPYLLTSFTMVGTVFCAVITGVVVATVALILLFAMTLKPQAELFGGRSWSYILAIIAVLFEATLLSLLLLKAVHKKNQKSIFLETMRLEGKWRPNEMIEPPSVDCGCCRLSVIVGILTFPLNIIFPIVGTVIFAFLNAPLAGKENMELYLDAVSMDSETQRVEVFLGGDKDNSSCCYSYNMISNEYTKFGFVCSLLESFPIIGPTFFSLTNACAAALWACEMEANGGPKTLRHGTISTHYGSNK